MVSEPGPRRRNKLARALLFFTSLLFFLLIATAGAEWVLHQNRERIRRSDRLDPNLVRHDPDIGWVLKANWRGEHKHHDFQASYSVDQRGFRADPGLNPKPGGKTYAVFGDSFTFGLGVNDDQTFVHLLNKATAPRAVFINCAVPGYSTDQESLAIERELPFLTPDVVLLVVYLANDIFDNQLPVPLQVNGAKPFYKLEGDRLTLCNSPVSSYGQFGQTEKPTLSSMVMGSNGSQNLLARFTAQSDVIGIFRDRGPFNQDHSEAFKQRFAAGVDLFSAIIKRTAAITRARGMELKVILLAGRSYIETPKAISGQYQEVLRQQIHAQKPEGVEIIDLAEAMMGLNAAPHASWFFPNDGHLNPIGHQVVADILGRRISVNSQP